MESAAEIDLNDFSHDVTSQTGEDGMLAELFRRLGVDSGYFVEFGAWDGKHLSNTHSLSRAGWRGCYIEADPDRFVALTRRFDGDDSVSLINAVVAEHGPGDLDTLLDRCDAPRRFDLCSIDIDGDDLAVWRGLRRHRPDCVVIEYNHTIPIGVRFENPPGRHLGNSSTALCDLAAENGYDLVAQTRVNLIFLDSELRQRHGIRQRELAPGRPFFVGFDGTLLVADRDESLEREFVR